MFLIVTITIRPWQNNFCSDVYYISTHKPFSRHLKVSIWIIYYIKQEIWSFLNIAVFILYSRQRNLYEKLTSAYDRHSPYIMKPFLPVYNTQVHPLRGLYCYYWFSCRQHFAHSFSNFYGVDDYDWSNTWYWKWEKYSWRAVKQTALYRVHGAHKHFWKTWIALWGKPFISHGLRLQNLVQIGQVDSKKVILIEFARNHPEKRSLANYNRMRLPSTLQNKIKVVLITHQAVNCEGKHLTCGPKCIK